jgi:hypothetical protein
VTLSRVIETGTYTGNGTSQSITIGWQPAFVQAVSTRTAGGPNQRGWATKYSGQSGSTSNKVQSTCQVATDIITIDATGFTVGADDSVNRNGETYHWWAIRECPCLDSDSYTGADPTDTALVLNRQPTWIFLSDQNTASVAIKYEQDADNTIWRYNTSGGRVAGLTIGSTGFTATGAELNDNGAVFMYLSFYDLVGATRHFETGSYTGSGAGQTITLGRQPRIILIEGTGSNKIGLKTDTMPDGGIGQVISTYTWGASVGPTMLSTGFSVPVGSWDTSAEVYNYVAGYF